MTSGLASLSEAIDWARDRWLERPVPLRLTVHDTDGELGGLRYSVPFERALDARANHTVEVDEQESCYHVNHPIGASLFECRCQGTGLQTVRRVRFRYPMWNAFSRLQNARNDMPRHPHPAELVVALASAGWQVEPAARRINRPVDVAEALFLTALRKLHGRYEEGPIGRTRPSWVDRSESQRNAEMAGEAA